MSTITSNEQALVGGFILGEIPYFPLPEQNLPSLLQISVPDFDIRIDSPIIKFSPEVERGELAIRVAFDKDVIGIVTLTGKLIEEGEKFLPEQVFLRSVLEESNPRANFINSTIGAIVGLAREVLLQIPDSEFNLKVRFDPPLLEISKALQARQIAYRLMVIEQATGKQFEAPPIPSGSPSMLSGKDVNDIAFVYRAIVDRSFTWPINLLEAEIPAIEEALAYLTSNISSLPYDYEVNSTTYNLLGETIQLGKGKIIIDDPFIDSVDEVKRKIMIGDGDTVEFHIGSRSGKAIYSFSEAPQLSDSPWNASIQKFIDLESQLDDRIVTLYNQLAASTLEGLNEEEIKEVTSNPELDYRGFLGESADSEDNR